MRTSTAADPTDRWEGIGQVTSPTQQLAPALDVDARLTEIERGLNLLLNLTPVSYTHLTLPTILLV